MATSTVSYPEPRQAGTAMSFLRRAMSIPATESQMGIALALSLIMMALLLWGIIWQSEVISYQRQIIKFLFNYR